MTRTLHAADLPPGSRIDRHGRLVRKSASRSRQRAVGDAAEAVVIDVLARVRAAYPAICITRRSTPYRIVGSTTRGLLCVPDSSQGVDFAGDVCGRAIYLEAKSVEKSGRYYLRNMIEPQRTELDNARLRGAHAYLVTVRAGIAMAHEWSCVRALAGIAHSDGVDLGGLLRALHESVRCREWQRVMP